MPHSLLCPSGAGAFQVLSFHGFRFARLLAGFAPPVATIHRPSGARCNLLRHHYTFAIIIDGCALMQRANAACGLAAWVAGAGKARETGRYHWLSPGNN